MGGESEGQNVLQWCGEEVSGYIWHQWVQIYLQYNMQIQSYWAVASDQIHQLVS